MEMNVKATSPTITGVLSSVASAKKPQDFEIIPSNEDITVVADEGCYIRSVIVKAISSSEEETGGIDNGESGENGESVNSGTVVGD
jgi:hypothetical protein